MVVYKCPILGIGGIAVVNKRAVPDATIDILRAMPTDEHCSRCDGRIIFEHDSDTGYCKSCLNCGYIEYLHRRFLRWNGQHRRWE